MPVSNDMYGFIILRAGVLPVISHISRLFDFQSYAFVALADWQDNGYHNLLPNVELLIYFPGVLQLAVSFSF